MVMLAAPTHVMVINCIHAILHSALASVTSWINAIMHVQIIVIMVM